MRSVSLILALFFSIALVSPASPQDRTFGDFDCTDDCSGHSAGYKWADKHSIDNEDDCPAGNSQSFHEGCIAYSRDPYNDPDADDQGNEAGMPVTPSDSDDDDQQ